MCSNTNAKLSPSKLKTGKEVTFGGHRISHDDSSYLVLIQPSLEKLEAIKNLRVPSFNQEVQSLVGFLSQLA